MSDDLDQEDRDLIARLRALPTEGTEPSWDQFGRELARKLDAAPAKPWWRRWWAPAIGVTLAGATAAAVLMWPQPEAAPVVVAEVVDDAAPEPAPVPAPPRPSRPGDAILALGAEGEVDDADLDLDDEDVIAGVMEALDDGEDEALEVDDDDEGEDLAAIGDVPEDPIDGLVPDFDLDWVDDLEDEDLDAVDAWLEDEAG